MLENESDSQRWRPRFVTRVPRLGRLTTEQARRKGMGIVVCHFEEDGRTDVGQADLQEG